MLSRAHVPKRSEHKMTCFPSRVLSLTEFREQMPINSHLITKPNPTNDAEPRRALALCSETRTDLVTSARGRFHRGAATREGRDPRHFGPRTRHPAENTRPPCTASAGRRARRGHRGEGWEAGGPAAGSGRGRAGPQTRSRPLDLHRAVSSSSSFFFFQSTTSQ